MPPPETPTFEDAAARFRAALAARPRRTLRLDGFRPAAVLVPLLQRPEGPTLLFTRRTTRVPQHKGEISFPGGGAEDGEDAVAAALREAHEEVGLEPASVEVVGVMDDLPSVSFYVVTPVVAAVAAPPASFEAEEFEVHEPFEVPLATLLDPSTRSFRLWDPETAPDALRTAVRLARMAFEELDPVTGHHRIWSFDAGPDRNIWGLTAHILKVLIERTYGLGPG
ncbi:MAG TPA: CoA pyrophosphatase [Anaeromyxobacteraceae bacterium]|nr:CoA pyrophosphatase [Anaeromyxobacteraceae bacterium]